MPVRVISFDLFKAPKDVCLAHLISQDASMHRGLAVAMVRKFGQKSYIQAAAGHVGVGGVVCISDWKSPGRAIFHCVSKRHYYQKTTYTTLAKVLVTLRETMERFGYSKLAVPALGCGLDCLEFDLVHPLIEDAFAWSDIEVTICL